MKKIFLQLLIGCALLGVSFLGTSAKASTVPFANCYNKNGHAVCTPDYGAIISHTGRVIVNGWINYGPWHPRPGFGVMFP